MLNEIYTSVVPGDLSCIYPDPISPARSSIVLFDANAITKLRKPPPDLTDFLKEMRHANYQGSVAVSLLASIAETNYRIEDVTPSIIVDKRDIWVKEHFKDYHIDDNNLMTKYLPISTGNALFTLLYRVWSYYHSLYFAYLSITKFNKSSNCADALNQFFKYMQVLGAPSPSKVHLSLIASALIGNTFALRALNIREIPSKRMNGSWDLLQWCNLIDYYVKSPNTLVHPCLVTYDQNASQIIKSMRMTASGTFSFSFVCDKEEKEKEKYENIVQTLEKNIKSIPTMAPQTFFEQASELLPTEHRCPELEDIERLLWLCADELLAAKI